MTMVRIIYAFFLGLLLALFVGMGIAAYYPAPMYPEYPKILENTIPAPVPLGIETRPLVAPAEETPEQKAARDQYEREREAYETTIKSYNRNVSVIALSAGVILLVISLSLLHKIDILADGLLLGGIFNTIYSIGRGFATDDVKYQFFIISAGLLIALALGYLKFIAPAAKTEEKK